MPFFDIDTDSADSHLEVLQLDLLQGFQGFR